MKNILCYGDSNTWGYIPGGMGRFAPQVRWPGVMKGCLPPDYYVAESGLNGRTTIWEDPWQPWRSGRTSLPPTIIAASPLDLIIIMLGTNDLLTHTAWDVSHGAYALMKDVKRMAEYFTGGRPRILLVAPPRVTGPLPELDQAPGGIDMAAESEKFGKYYSAQAENAGAAFFDAALAAEPAPAGLKLPWGGTGDGIHLTPEGHRALGEALGKKVLEILGD